MYKIAVGTTSSQKIKYLREVLDEMELSYDIVPVEAESGVASQPMSSSETKNGSINRARVSLETVYDADFGIGVEAGYELEDSRYSIFCWASIIDKHGNVFSAQSEAFKLPNFHNEIITKGGHLGDKVRDYLNMQTEKFKKVLAVDIVDRTPFIPVAIRGALFYYLNQEEYK